MIGQLPVLSSGAFGQLGSVASRSEISKPASVTTKQLHCLFKPSLLDILVRHHVYAMLILAHSVDFWPNGFKNPLLNLCQLPRFVFLSSLTATLIWLLFLLPLWLEFLHHHPFFISFGSLL
jgi:hypothetical protein